MLIRQILFIIACLLVNSTAAAISNYDFRQDRSFTPGSLTFSGTAGNVEVYASNNTATASQIGASSRYGLLACTGPGAAANRWDCGGPSFGDTHYINGNSGTGADESIVVKFDRTVRLVSAQFFNNYGYNTDFDLFVANHLVLDERRTRSNVGFDNSGAYVGSIFRFRADGREDYFKLQSIQVADVPLPAAIWLFASGLVGIAITARRKAP